MHRARALVGMSGWPVASAFHCRVIHPGSFFMQFKFLQSITSVVLATCVLVLSPSASAAEKADPKLQSIINGSHRTADHNRDKYRHPMETLKFFGIAQDMTVVELWPHGGWYLRILAPYLRDKGKYYSVLTDAPADGEMAPYDKEVKTIIAGNQLYDKATVTVLSRGKEAIAPAGTADMVLTFRNIHNWLGDGYDKAAFQQAFKALKPGGILGVVEHRSDPNPTGTPAGYVAQQDAIKLAESAGFKLVAQSEINANPKDTKNYPKGVWTLPPTYIEGDKDRSRYEAIGESDRFTLKFQKPAT